MALTRRDRIAVTSVCGSQDSFALVWTTKWLWRSRRTRSLARFLSAPFHGVASGTLLTIRIRRFMKPSAAVQGAQGSDPPRLAPRLFLPEPLRDAARPRAPLATRSVRRLTS